MRTKSFDGLNVTFSRLQSVNYLLYSIIPLYVNIVLALVCVGTQIFGPYSTTI